VAVWFFPLSSQKGEIMNNTNYSPSEVLDLWFPDSGHQNDISTHAAFWEERMQGGMDARIIANFSGLTTAAASGLLDHWADTPRGRLALLIALDQFPRSLWRDTPAAFGQDIKATRLALEGIQNGDFAGLASWEQTFFAIAIGHCEGPDHLERMQNLTSVVQGIVDNMPGPLTERSSRLIAQHARVMGVIERFGRHPHRNPIYGRLSTPEEEAYIAEGDFPHLKKKTKDVGGG